LDSKRLTVCVRGAWRWGGRGFCLGAGKTRSQCLDKLDNQKMLENAADRASELQASIAQPKRVSAWHPQRPAARPGRFVSPLLT